MNNRFFRNILGHNVNPAKGEILFLQQDSVDDAIQSKAIDNITEPMIGFMMMARQIGKSCKGN